MYSTYTTGRVSLGNAPYLWRVPRDIQLYIQPSLQRFFPPTLLGKRAERNGTRIKHTCFVIGCIPLPLPPTNASSWLDLELCLPLPQGVQPYIWITDMFPHHPKAVSSPLLPSPAGGLILVWIQILDPAGQPGSCKCSHAPGLCQSLTSISSTEEMLAGIKHRFSWGPLPTSGGPWKAAVHRHTLQSALWTS